MNDGVVGARLKIERANQHIAELDEVVSAYFRECPPVVAFKDYPATGKRHFTVLRAKESPPQEAAIIAGEILYLQRSALEHSFALAIFKRGHYWVDTGFPIEATEKKFEDAIYRRKITERLPRLTAVLRVLKPYKGGNELFYQLNALNGAEKHKALVPIAIVQTFREVKFTAPIEKALAAEIADDGWFRNDKDYELMTLPMEAHLDPQIQFETGIAFSEVEGAEFETMQTTMEQFSDLVLGTLNMFINEGLIE